MMRSIKAKLKKPAPTNGSKDDWSKTDQRIWHSVAAVQPAKLAAKLNKHSEVNVNKICPSVGYSVVHYAAAKGLDDCLNVLLAHKANVSTRDVTGATPLHASARYGHRGTTTKLLASRTVDVNARDKNNCTALHFAAFEGHLDCLKLIAGEKHCDIHCVDKDGRTALMVASAMGRLAVCQELIKQGIDVNHQDFSDLQHTALTLAAEAGHAEVVKLLCDSGANYAATLSDGRTALDIARGRNRRNVVDTLHVIQLTEAAKKTDRGARLSTSGKGQEKSEAKTETEKSSEVKPTPVARTMYAQESMSTLLHSSPQPKREELKQEASKPAADQHTNATVLSMYNDTRHGGLYDRDVSLYDSRSTLASLSSLDASTSVHEANKSVHLETPSTPQTHAKESSKDVLKLSEDLLQKEEQIAALEQRLRDVSLNSTREVESLKTSNAKYEKAVQELEKANDQLSKECLKLQRENKEIREEIEKHRSDSKELAEYKEKLGSTESRLAQTDEQLKASVVSFEEVQRLNQDIMSRYRNEQKKNKTMQTGLKQIFVDIGRPTDDGDYQDYLRLLKHEILQAKEKSAKKSETAEERKLEIEQLQNKISEQNNVIEALQLQLNQSKHEVGKANTENQKLVLTVRDIKEQFEQLEQGTAQHILTNARLKKEVSNLKEKLTSKSKEDHEIKDLEAKLQVSLSMSEQVVKEYEQDKLMWKRTESVLEGEVKEVNEKYDQAKQEAVSNEKVISELRVERNQREARISKLEKDLLKSESKRKETEVETNRSRQQLTETKQKFSKLQDEATALRKSKKELSTKLNSVKMYECTELERKKIDSLKTQLEHLCKHIQESEKKYNETISIYRGHLLMAAKGELNPDVLIPLKEILKLREEPHSSNNL